MQESFDFACPGIDYWRARLGPFFGALDFAPRRRPLGQMVKSMISSRTRDEISLPAFERLQRRWPHARDLAAAPVSAIEAIIFDVTFADKKAAYIPAALRMIAAERPGFDLDFLGTIPVPDALAWLERLPGVGRKVAAATLNASTLRRPVFIVDTHVHRVLQRFGFIGRRSGAKAASEAVTAAAHALSADELHDLFARIKLLGQTICRFDAPACMVCPLADGCRSAKAVDAQAA